MSTTAAPTPQQIAQQLQPLYAEFQKRLLPAKLKHTQQNLAALENKMIAMNLIPCPPDQYVDHLLKAVNAMLFDGVLVWDKEPAKLASRKENQSASRYNSTQPLADQEAFRQKSIAGDKKVEQAKSDEKTGKAIAAAIAGFHPTGRLGALDAAAQERHQVILNKYVETEMKRGCAPTDNRADRHHWERGS